MKFLEPPTCTSAGAASGVQSSGLQIGVEFPSFVAKKTYNVLGGVTTKIPVQPVTMRVTARSRSGVSDNGENTA